MSNHFTLNSGSGGSGVDAGVGGRGGDIHVNFNSNEPESLDTALLMSLPRAGYAAHDSSRGDAPSSCLEGTRVAILEGILSWCRSANGERPPVYWLSGLAGIGKSTIAKTVAELAQGEAMLGASFFFSRSDDPLRDPRLVLPTLAFELTQSDSTFKTVIVQALRQDQKLGHKKLLHQIEGLILEPLSKINPLRSPTLIILDALDECEEKGAVELLQLVFSHAIQIPFLRILITSRPQPHLSSVFNKVPNLEKTVLHDIDASLVQQDIRLYISTELAKIPGKLDLRMPADWATQNQTSLLVEKSGKLFIYAATAIRFVGDDRMRDPPSQLDLVLNTRSAQEVGATPYSQLDDLYMGVLSGSLSSSNRRESLRRFQIVVGSIVLLREPLPLSSLARFAQYERHIVEATLYHLHSVIIPPSDIHEAPRIYHPSFLEFITDASRCSMTEFVIGPEQELRHAMRCFELMKKDLKRDVAGISDPSLLNKEVDGLEQKVADALSPEVQYACRYWASHLSCVESGEKRMVEALEAFSMRSILWWLEAMSLIGSVSTAVSSIQEAHRWAISSKCKLILVTMLSDAYRFILAHGEVVRGSALHVYHSALPFTPHNTVLFKAYFQGGKDSIRVLQGVESEWPRTLSTLIGHLGWVNTVAFSPNGLCLASGASDGTVRLWDAISGEPIAELQHGGSVLTVAFSPDGSHLASLSMGTLKLWDVSGIPIGGLDGSDIDNFSSTSGPIFLSPSPSPPLGGGTPIAFFGDGFSLALGPSDASPVQLLDTMSGMCITWKSHYHRLVTVEALEVLPNGLHLSFSWDKLDNDASDTLISWLGDGDMTVAFLPDGLHLLSGDRMHLLSASSYGGPLQLWDALSNACIARLLDHHWVTTVAFSPDGLHLLSDSSNCGPLQLWDAVSTDNIPTLGDDDYEQITTVAFSPDGLYLVSDFSNHGSLQFWDVMSGTLIDMLEGHSGRVRTLAFSPDGSCLISGSNDHTLQLWDTMSRVLNSKLEGHSDLVTTLAFSLDGLCLASASRDQTLWLWDAMSGMPIAKLEGHSGSVTAIAFSPNGSHLASGSNNGTLWLWDARANAPISKLEGHSKWVTTVAFSPDGLHLASASDNHTLCLWDATSGVSIAKLEGHSGSITTIDFSPAGLRLASGSKDHTLWLWDAKSGVPIVRLEGHSGGVRTVAFLPNGWLASGSDDCTLRLWEAISGTPIARLGGHSSSVTSIASSFDGGTLISCTDAEVLMWDLTSYSPQQVFFRSSSAAHRPIGLTPLIWSLHDHWIQVEHGEDHIIRHVCYIPPHYSPSTSILVSTVLAQTRVAVGCRDGHMIILSVPDQVLMEE